HKKVFFLIMIFTIFCLEIHAQSGRNAQVEGKIVDASTATPLSFASVAIYHSQEETLVDGSITNEVGDFSIELPYGSYYALIEFMGYDALNTTNFEFNRYNMIIDLGFI